MADYLGAALIALPHDLRAIHGLETTWTRTVNRAPRRGVELDEMLPGEIAARLAEATACNPARDLEAKVAALEARLPATK